MAVNPVVLLAIADRLAQGEGQWKPMQRKGLRRMAYRAPQQPVDFSAFANAAD